MDSLKTKILEILKQHNPTSLRLNDISKQLGVRSDSREYEQLRTFLDELVNEEVLYRSSRRKYGLAGITHETTFEGTVEINGFNGVVSTSSSLFPHVHIRRPNLFTALNGDTVKVKLLALSKDKKPTGEIISIVKRAQSTVVGKIDFESDFCFLIPDDERIHVDFLVHPKRLHGAQNGDKVAARLIRWDDPFKSPEAEIVEVLGQAGVPKVEYASVAKEFHLRPDFPAQVVREAEQVAIPPTEQEIARRHDFRAVDIVTIDPIDAKDFDDALSLEELPNGNYRLGVHIADVSHYVREGSALDKEAEARATSVYLVDGVIPMLPEELSNNICSLVPYQDRFAFSVVMEISPRGSMKSYEIVESVINSKHRFTYEQAQEIIVNNNAQEHPFGTLILRLHDLATQLRKKRFKSGGIDFETTEVKFILDEQKRPVQAILKSRSDATSLVEECMLLANQTVAQHIRKVSPVVKRKKTLLPFLYRIHDTPSPDKLEAALVVLRGMGVKIEGKVFSSKQINDLLASLKERSAFPLFNQLLLRSMAKAVYSAYNIGHYGLGFEFYSHFTSPIRRYPDLLIHRLLKEYAQGGISEQRLEHLQTYCDSISDHCSAQEVLATEAERASIKLTQASIALERIGEEFNGVVTGVTNFGLFVRIDEIYAEGLLKMRDLDNDYYYFDERRFALIGRRTRAVFRFGSRLRVRIARVNIEKREIDFTFVGKPQEGNQDKNQEHTSVIPEPEAATPEEVEAVMKYVKKVATKTEVAAKKKKAKRTSAPKKGRKR